MTDRATTLEMSRDAAPALQAYVLDTLPFEDALALQRRLIFDVSGGAAPALILCDHPGVVTVGRQGSFAHYDHAEAELRSRRWPTRWVNRGGGCWLHVPGQLVVYAVLPLDRLGLSLGAYLTGFQRAILAVVEECWLQPQVRAGSRMIWLADRPVAALGLAVRESVTYYGAVLNVNPDLVPFRWVRSGRGHAPMTSLEREARRPVRPAHVRERFVEHFIAQFGFDCPLWFSGHPLLRRKGFSHATAAAR